MPKTAGPGPPAGGSFGKAILDEKGTGFHQSRLVREGTKYTNASRKKTGIFLRFLQTFVAALSLHIFEHIFNHCLDRL